MALTPQKRKQMEDLTYRVLSALDKTGANTDKYKTIFKGMTDAQFDAHFKKIFSNENEYLVLDIIDYERDIKMEDIEDAANILKIPLTERIALPAVNKDKQNPVITKYEVPVGYIHVKRVQQMLRKKNTSSTEISSRSAITGQVVGKDKNAKDTDVENFGLVTLSALHTLEEFMGPRADDLVMKNEMYSQIAKNGYVSLASLTNNVENKTTLNTLNVFFLGMGLDSDLVTNTLVLKNTLKK